MDKRPTDKGTAGGSGGGSAQENVVQGRGEGTSNPQVVTKPRSRGKAKVAVPLLAEDGFPGEVCMTLHSDLEGLREKYSIPGAIGISVPSKTDRMHLPRKGCMAVNLLHFRYGLRFPLNENVSKILTDLGVAVAQLNLNALALIITWVILCERYRLPCSTGGFLHFFRVHINAKDNMITVLQRHNFPFVGSLASSHGATAVW